MKGVILAAGMGTRLLPITKATSKVVLPVYNKPAIFFSIETLIRSGVKEMIIVCHSTNKKQVQALVGNGKDFGAKSVKYLIKDHNLGMPYSILQAEKWAKKSSVMVMPGDNVYLDTFDNTVKAFKKGAVAHLLKVKNPEKSGVPKYKNKILVDIVEKPKNPPSRFAVIAPYFFDNKVHDFIRKLKPSKRGELEITELLKMYLKLTELQLHRYPGYWNDIGDFDSLHEASIYMKRRSTREKN